MRTSISSSRARVAGFLGVLALAPLAVQATPTFDGWSVTSGTIDAANGSYCTTAGVVCDPLVSGNGFLQQQVTDNGVVYIQTIITDTGASGTPSAGLPFSDESFIRQGATTGIMDRQRSAESSPSFTFSNAATLFTGWAAAFIPAGGANMNINQSFTDAGNTAVTGDGLFNSFVMNINQTAAGVVTGKTMSLRQDLGLGDGTSNNANDTQSFVVEQRTGDLLPAGTGSLTLNNPDTGPVTVSWQSGEDVLLAWLGQKVCTGDSTNCASASPTLSFFGFESITNAAAGAAAPTTGSTSSQTVTDVSNGAGGVNAPYDWDTIFGAAPTLSAPQP